VPAHGPSHASRMRVIKTIARLPWLGALAIESRVRPANAEHASWIARNLLATCGRWVHRHGPALDSPPRVLCLDDDDPRTLLAALAAFPALPVGPSLGATTRALLRVVGIPTVPEVTGDVRTLVGDPRFARGPIVRVAVSPDATGYLVALDDRTLLAA
jgi:hypothetical protein